MTLSRARSDWLRAGAGLTLAFLYVPLLIIAIYAFSEATTLEWPPPGFTPSGSARRSTTRAPGRRSGTRSRRAPRPPAIALVLGTLASLAVARHRFFGRETISFLVILPIALPGIVTGIALNSTFTQVLGIDLSLFTIVVGHATFCIVVVYNNVVARLRRISSSLEEASADLGADHVADVPPGDAAQHAHRAGGGRAARLRPLLRRDHRHHVHRGAASRRCRSGSSPTSRGPTSCRSSTSSALLVILISIIPVYLAYRLTRDEGVAAAAAAEARRVKAEATAVP